MIPAKIHMTESNDIAARPLSRLSYQIMGLNLMALFVLIAGIFYLDQYKKDLTAAETEILATETQLYASLTAGDESKNEKIDLEATQKLFSTFSAKKIQRLRLFDANGNLLIDTKTPGQTTQDPEALQGFIRRASEVIFDSFTDLFSINFKLPLYPIIKDIKNANSFPDAIDALKGQSSLSAWQSKEGGLILSAATPVTKKGQVIGALLVTRVDTKIEHTFDVMRLSIIQFFFGSLLITLLFSLYLSAIIGHPLRKLATSAEAVREGRGGVELIPDFSSRRDEIGELSLSLRQMTDALQDRIESIERFAADVSHELKNPLTSMRSAIETLEKVKLDQDRQKLMNIIMHDLLRMDRLISDISRASRLDVELLREALVPLDIRSVILPLVDAFRKPLDRAADQKDDSHNIQYSGPDTPVMVLGHSVRLSQVFQNLIANALSFSPPGGHAGILVQKGNEFISITVEDQGPGIPENRFEKIFERFYTERPGSESFGAHSGLGLSIVRQIVKAHDGSITAQNIIDDSGKVTGARFIVKLKSA